MGGYDKEWEWFGDTALIAASRNGHFNIVKALLLAGADPTLSSCPTDDVYETAEQAAEKQKMKGKANAYTNILAILKVALGFWSKAKYASHNFNEERKKAFKKKPNQPSDKEAMNKALAEYEVV